MSYENSVNVSFGLGCGGDHLGFGVGGVQPTGRVWKSVERKFFAVSILLVISNTSEINFNNQRSLRSVGETIVPSSV